MAFVAKCASSVRLVVLSYGRMPTATLTYCYKFCLLSGELSSLLLHSFERFSPSRSVLAFDYGAGEDYCLVRIWAPLLSRGHFTTETTWVSFRTLCICFPLEAFSHLPVNVIFSFLFESWSLLFSQQLRSGLWNFEFSSFDQNEVLQKSSILDNSFVLGSGTVSWSFKAKTVCSWTESSNFDLYIFPRTISVEISLADKIELGPSYIEILDVILQAYIEQIWESLYCYKRLLLQARKCS